MKTIVIGAGQAGLAVARALDGRGEDDLLMEASARVGDTWRRRWRSLTLFTPAQHDGLPGLSFPAPRGSFPRGDQFGDYLERYSQGLALRTGSRVESVTQAHGGWQVSLGSEQLVADNVVIATGANARAAVPACAAELADGIRQPHSSQYHQPSDVADGVVPRMPGLYFVGLPYQYGLTSGLIGGVGCDAVHVAAHIARQNAK